jgi:hypothetical protein
MSEVFKYNTDVAVQESTGKQPTLNLVGENNPILKEIMPEFDFKNPPGKSNGISHSFGRNL